ncbi:MAG TPA: formimidoylglutamase [Salinimicrobium sp.]|nr:formimidoylglutamase [Salinimicrobium sp.]
MPKLKFYNSAQILKLTSLRSGETKAGEKFSFVSSLDELKNCSAQFVLFGIPEDIGVRANYGKPGTSNAWSSFLAAFVNIQQNRFFDFENLILLGEINCSEEMQRASNLDFSDPNYAVKMGELVEKIDEVVAETVKTIISAGKIPIIIGGGHNNAFGNLKGASEAFSTTVNVINIDAHTDLRQLEHRHSGNGFSYAREKAFLKKYAVFGLHENYTPQYIFDKMNALDDLKFTLLDDFLLSEKTSAFQETINFVNSEKFGLEIDCDAISGFPSSAVSPSGLLFEEVRGFIKMASKEENCAYLHICEAVATDFFPTGKAIGFMVTDFLK